MARLIKCIECNKQLSSDARSCPHCKTSHPDGVVCELCSGKLKKSESLQAPSSYGSFSYKSFHKDCFENLQNVVQLDTIIPKPKVTACPVCRKGKFEIPFTKNASPPKSLRCYCESCGHQFGFSISDSEWPYSNCFYCDQVLIKKGSIKFKDVTGTYDHDAKDVYTHSLCYQASERRSNRSDVYYKRSKDNYKTYQRTTFIWLFFPVSVLISWLCFIANNTGTGWIFAALACFLLIQFIYYGGFD